MADSGLHISLVCTVTAGQVAEVQIDLPQGARVADALCACSTMPIYATVDMLGLDAGVWGKLVPHTWPLADGDRVELYRPLTVDPKVARRTRFTRQGAGRAGLFTKKRAGAKAGY